jgi:hypothetical protein
MTRLNLLQLGVAAGIVASTPVAATAQHVTANLPPNPTVVRTTATVVVGSVFGVTTTPVLQLTPARDGGGPFNFNGPCDPGACFEATVMVRANTKWRLQIALTSTPPDFTVTLVASLLPFVTQQLSAGDYQTVVTGPIRTNGQPVLLFLTANKTKAKGAFVPTAAQLASVLSYRVIAAP